MAEGITANQLADGVIPINEEDGNFEFNSGTGYFWFGDIGDTPHNQTQFYLDDSSQYIQLVVGTGGTVPQIELDGAQNEVRISATGGGRIEIGGAVNQRVIVQLPTADPGVAGQLWNDGGTVKVSAG